MPCQEAFCTLQEPPVGRCRPTFDLETGLVGTVSEEQTKVIPSFCAFHRRGVRQGKGTSWVVCQL